MSELNKKTCLSVGRSINGEYKMNLYEGDTLEMDIESVWNIDLTLLWETPYNTELKQQVRRLYTTCLLNVILINVIICLYNSVKVVFCGKAG
jgi:hypothetical protein